MGAQRVEHNWPRSRSSEVGQQGQGVEGQEDPGRVQAQVVRSVLLFNNTFSTNSLYRATSGQEINPIKYLFQIDGPTRI